MTIFNTALVIVGTFLLNLIGSGLYYYLFPEDHSIPEKYPFEATVLLGKMQLKLLDHVIWIYEQGEKLGFSTIRVRVFGLPPFVFTKDVKNITYILKTNFQNFAKTGYSLKSKFQRFLGDGIFNSDGPIWYAHRKTSANLFKLDSFRSFIINVFNDDLNLVIRNINNAGVNAIEIQALFHNFTLESIAQIALGTKLGCLEEGKFIQFAYDFDFCTAIAADSCNNPLWFLSRIFTEWEYRQCLSRINQVCYDIIQNQRIELSKKDSSDEKNDKQNSLINLYLRKEYLNNDNEDDGNSENKLGFPDTYIEPTDKNLRDVVLNIILAGRDTTAQALTWSFYRLCIHQNIQNKIREEAIQVLSSSYDNYNNISEYEMLKQNGFIGNISFKSVQKMKYLDAFITELLRLHPSVPGDAKIVQSDCVLPDGVKLYKGNFLVYHPYVMGRSKEFWGDDALEFKPERFLDTSKPSPYIYTAFQAGPRMCLGMNFAQLEMKCAIARLLVAFEFTLAQDPSTVTYKMSLTHPVAGGMMVSAKSLLA
eukprot:gene10854-14571_t